ncbi:unnamed protein product [Thelazia callipaeda]|uniref:PWWP domain-containing protein n=1 Tax=Thelazia callipaeda TaxID=103827 RepID=A0A0N5CLS4_THECL|nr:unnamed protein product [Thelazia callipaeda]
MGKGGWIMESGTIIMGRFPIPSEKQRQQIMQHRKNYEISMSANPHLQRQRRGASAPPKVSEVSLANLTDQPKVIQAEVLRSSPGVMIVEYVGQHTNTRFTGVLFAENGIFNGCSPNGVPGIISQDMSRFRQTVRAYVDAPIIDQWTSVIGERLITSGLHMRTRNYMRKNGRMVCASCMEAVPDNEIITRKHFVNVNQRKLHSIPKDNKRVVAQLPPSEKQLVDGLQLQIVDELTSEFLDAHLNGSAGGYSPDTSMTSALFRQRNKRKAYIPRGACSVLVPAGVDLFEPEYDPLPGPSSGPNNDCSVEPSHKLSKNAIFKKRVLSASASKHRRSAVDQVRSNVSGRTFVSVSTSSKVDGEDGKKDVQNVDSSARRFFKSDKIRKAFSSEYSIRKPVSDSLHMTFIRQSNDPNLCLSVGDRSRLAKVDSCRGQISVMPSIVDNVPSAINSLSVVHSSEAKRIEHDKLEKSRCSSNKVGSKESVNNEGHIDRPPIKIVLKSIKKSMVEPLQTNCEVQQRGSNGTNFVGRTSVRPIADSRCKSVSKKIMADYTPAPKRRSETGCPPMMKASSARISTRFVHDEVESRKSKKKTSMGGKMRSSARRPGNDDKLSSTSCTGKSSGLLTLNNFRIGDVVWARNGMFPYWPGRIYEFVKENKKSGASILWFGDNTYTPFTDFSRIEKFTETYDTRFVINLLCLMNVCTVVMKVMLWMFRFNPLRQDHKYHKAVASAIMSCFPVRGYFESKLSPQVYGLLQKGNVTLGEINIITKAKKRTLSTSSNRRRKIAVKKVKDEKMEEETAKDVPTAVANVEDPIEVIESSSIISIITLSTNPESVTQRGAMSPSPNPSNLNSAMDPKGNGGDTPPLMIVYDSD